MFAGIDYSELDESHQKKYSIIEDLASAQLFEVSPEDFVASVSDDFLKFLSYHFLTENE